MLRLPVWLQIIEGNLEVLEDGLPLPLARPLPDVLIVSRIIQAITEAQETVLGVLRLKIIVIIKLGKLIRKCIHVGIK